MNLRKLQIWTLLALGCTSIAGAQTQFTRLAPTNRDVNWHGIHGIDADHAWVVGGRSTACETRDGGKTWIEHQTGSLDHSPFNTVVSPTPGVILISGNGDTELRSTNGGLTWQKKSGFSNTIQAYFYDFVTPQIGHASYGTGQFTTTNGGQTWSGFVGTPDIRIYGFDYWNQNTGLAAGDDSNSGAQGIFRTNDGGHTWSHVLSGATNTVLFLDANSAMTAMGNSIMVSANGGTSWFPRGMVESSDVFKLQRFGSTSNLAAITTDWTIFHSPDLGFTWTKVFQGLAQPMFPDRWANLHCSTDTVGWAVSNPGCIVRTLDSGATWHLVTVPSFVAYNTMSMPDGKNGYAVASPNYAMATHDAGKTWNIQKLEVLGQSAFREETLQSVDVLDANTAFVAGRGGVVFKTGNGGQTWESIGYPRLDDELMISSVDFTNPLNGWVCGYDPSAGDHRKNLFHTTDGGQSWNLVYTNIDSQFHQAGGFGKTKWLNADTGFLTGTNSTPFLMRTLDGGATWSNVTMPSHQYPPYITDIEFRSATEGWICGSYGYALRTTNGGATWVKVNTGTLLDGFNAIAFPTPNTIWLFGGESFTQNAVLYRSNNNGVSWTKEVYSPFPYVASDAAYTAKGQVWLPNGMGSILEYSPTHVSVVPTGYQVLGGTYVSGSAASFAAADFNTCKITRPENATLDTIQLELTYFTTLRRPSEIIVNTRNRIVGAIGSEQVELYNWQTDSWDRVQYNAHSSSFTLVDTRLTNKPIKYVRQSDGQIKVRLTAIEDENAFAPPWQYEMDMVKLQLHQPGTAYQRR